MNPLSHHPVLKIDSPVSIYSFSIEMNDKYFFKMMIFILKYG